ncbi:MAG: hypothetical protein U1C66_02540 [Patescibacteria group bacterium]|nr:hypothetical protein [Patescibacteria group bacterium]
MTRKQKLERWAELLDVKTGQRLNTLHGTEYQMGLTREDMRADNSPISVAFKDPVLRTAGLRDDTYGEAKRFFELTDWQLHDILCYCHFGSTMTAETAARGVRAANTGKPGPGLFLRMQQAIRGG